MAPVSQILPKSVQRAEQRAEAKKKAALPAVRDILKEAKKWLEESQNLDLNKLKEEKDF
jgi:hypothetical protein